MKARLAVPISLTLFATIASTGCSRADDAGGTAALSAPPVQALTTTVYNPGEQGIFQVSSVLVSGARDAILIDAQFSAADANKLVEMIRASGKRLTTIYVSHGDPDYYFGLDTLHASFPEAKILAAPQTVAHIKETQAGKLAVWGPQLGANAPKRIEFPEPLSSDRLELEGSALEIIGLDGPTPERSFVWIPSIKTVAGGVLVWGNQHVWMADTQTPQSHTDWLATLDRIRALGPEVVIPGHFAPGAPQNVLSVTFTADYIRAFDEEATRAKNPADLIAAMRSRYPGLSGESSLELSAKVAKGEMKWP